VASKAVQRKKRRRSGFVNENPRENVKTKERLLFIRGKYGDGARGCAGKKEYSPNYAL